MLPAVTDAPAPPAFLDATTDAAFATCAEAAFRRQTAHNPVYRAFAGGAAWTAWDRVPYLPVEAFRLAPVAAFDVSEAEAVFESSGTGLGPPARHYVRRLATYRAAFLAGFRRAFGPGPFALVGHLPRYADRGAKSSLLYMVEGLVEAVGDAESGLFLDDASRLERAAAHAERSGTPLVVFGAAFGLMDLVEAQRWRLPAGARVVETGGMKTHRRDLSRADLHAALADGFGLPVASVWSEYGMCELFSQAYAPGGPVFEAPPWLRARVVDPLDAERPLPFGTPGRLALCDLANADTCSFLLTEDQAVAHPPGADGTSRFEVLGRLPAASLRGCNFLVER